MMAASYVQRRTERHAITGGRQLGMMGLAMYKQRDISPPSSIAKAGGRDSYVWPCVLHSL
jgi:hypothetical protein